MTTVRELEERLNSLQTKYDRLAIEDKIDHQQKLIAVLTELQKTASDRRFDLKNEIDELREDIADLKRNPPLTAVS